MIYTFYGINHEMKRYFWYISEVMRAQQDAPAAMAAGWVSWFHRPVSLYKC